MMIPAFAMPFVGGLAASAIKGVASAFGDALKPAESDPKLLKAKATAQDFESMFLEDMVDRVFASTGAEGPLGDNGLGGDVYKSMLAKELARSISQAGGIGLAREVYGELLKLQEAPGADGR